MATVAQCKKCVYHKDCPILEMMRQQGIKDGEIFRKKCISYKDKK